jgi:hypothetical protein
LEKSKYLRALQGIGASAEGEAPWVPEEFRRKNFFKNLKKIEKKVLQFNRQVIGYTWF